MARWNWLRRSMFVSTCGMGADRRPAVLVQNITEEFAMSTSVIGLFEDQDTARNVVDALTKAGFNSPLIYPS